MTRDAIVLIGGRDVDTSTRLSGILRQNGYSVRSIASGSEALDFIESQAPALILLAARPEDMSEFEFCRRVKLRRRGCELPLLLVTRNADEQAQSFRYGASDYISEPLRTDEVLARVSGQLALSRLQADALHRDNPVSTESTQPDGRTVPCDASQLERVFATLNPIFDAAPVMLWVSGPDKLCTFFNKGWLAFTGRTLQQELGYGWVEGVHAGDLERCRSTYSAAFDARETFQMEYRLRRADGEYRWLLENGNPRFSTDRAFVGYIGSAIDITESKRNQELLLVTQKLESVGLLAGGAVHDINNFLGCILANTDKGLSELGAHSRTRRNLQQIETIAHRALEIAHQVMLYTGQTAQQIETVDVARLIREMLQLLRVCIPKDAELKVHLPASLLLARANASQLRQVIMNLLLNAGEAIEGHKGEIHITVRKQGAVSQPHDGDKSHAVSGDCVCLEVADTGKGMTEDVKKRIFEPFFTTKVAGRGLGLAAAQEIVRSHGGTIGVTSAPGHGTTFQILLPCHGGSTVDAKAPQSPTATIVPRPGSILIVEDEETLRVSVATMLRKRGFSVLEASDGNCAVDLIRANTEEIAVVLLDLTLPGKSSQEVFQELRRHRPGVKVLLTSAYGWENIVGPLKALRSEDFIRKPYRLHELVTAVSQVLPSDHLVAGRSRQS